MHLKELRAENFKSFGKSIRIPFMEGYTTVTGPNGCGKSNIFDAILFVLGPKSSKAVRAKKLTDLIFNGGSDKKKGSSFCEVSLIFDNTDRMIPLETDEVKLTRYIRLSDTTPEGYNSYFYINDRKSSLGEFDALLSHARISADGYNFVQQGDAAKLAKISDVERRKILEDIAGITKFDEDIARADVKKSDVEANMERVRIIMDEISAGLAQLEKDREGALKRRELEQKLSLCKAQLAYKNKNRMEEEIRTVTEAIRKSGEDIKAMGEAKETFTAKLAEVTANLDKIEKEIAKRGGDEAKELKAKTDEMRLKAARANDAINNAKDNLRLLAEEEAELKAEVTRLKKEISTKAPRKGEVEQKLQEKSALLKTKEKELSETRDHLAKSDTEVAGVQRELLVIKKGMEQGEAELSRLRIECESGRAQLQRLEAEVAEMEERKTTEDREIADAQFMLDQVKNAIRSGEKSQKQLQDEFSKAKMELEKLRLYAKDLENIVREKSIEYEKLKTEASVAENLQKGYSNAVASILEARDRGFLKGVHGTIAELATVSKEHETAMNIAAGSRMQSLVVDDDECAAKAINYLKQKKCGRATFLPMNKMIEGKPRGKALLVVKDPNSLGFAIDLIKFKEEYRAAFSYVFGDTVIMKDMNSARAQMGGVRLVTLDGEQFEPAGAMVGGTVGKQQLSFGIPTKNEISKLGAELANATEELEKTGKALLKAEEKVREVEEKLRQTSGKTDVSGLKMDELEKRKNEARTRFEKILAEVNGKSQELAKCRKKLETDEAARTECEGTLENLHKKREVVEKKGVEILPERLQKKMLDMTQGVSALKEEVTALKFEKDTIDQQVSGTEERLKEFMDKLGKNESSVKENKKLIDKGTKDYQAYREELEVLQKTEAGSQGKMKELFDEKIRLIEEKTRLEKDGQQNLEKLNAKQDELIDNQTRLKEAETSLAEIMVEVQGYKLDESQKLPSWDYLKTTISDSEKQIAAMGDVNMKALDEYDIKKKRADELKVESGRLEGEKKDLITLVAELTEKKKDGLYKVFNPINENLKDVYAKLSNGGYAELVMENPEDPFKGGIVMKVKPHEKKMISILSLSGGEQSLAALSFIIAIQRYDPSPFYVLDEVDQNLDAINAERAAKYIKASSKGWQFIQVSLRKATLKEADHIIGVTIQKSGISEVVMKVNIGDVNDKGEISGHPSVHTDGHGGGASDAESQETLGHAAEELAGHLNRNGINV